MIEYYSVYYFLLAISEEGDKKQEQISEKKQIIQIIMNENLESNISVYKEDIGVYEIEI